MLPFNRDQNKRSAIVFLKRLQSNIRFVFTLPIIIYQRVFSSNFIPLCRFVPSCSEYTRHAILKYGVLRGIFYGALRILRCGPFSKGGYDPLR